MKNKIHEKKFCCTLMGYLLNEGKVLVKYNDYLREYCVKLHRDIAKQEIYYCPWCGKKLPGSLRDKWFQILRTEYEIKDPMDDKRKLPKEFRSDEWWKKRGL